MWEEIVKQFGMLPELFLSVLLGFIIGLERKKRSKEAGVRTHTIVCFGAALMMIVSKFAFNSAADSARVAAQIVSGVGFLGAGMIVYKQHEVKGLTTAAGVWATAGIGMACGGSLYLVAVVATILMLGVQLVFHTNLRVFTNKKSYSVKIEFYQTGEENLKIKEIFGTDRFNHLMIKRENGNVIYSATLHTEEEFSSTHLNEVMANNAFISSIERCDNV
jgi:putative Mg2+ transporter-C (MgtC) family protein